MVIAAFIAGVFLVVTAFSREPDKRRLRISVVRLIGGLFLLAVVAGVTMVLVAGSDLARAVESLMSELAMIAVLIATGIGLLGLFLVVTAFGVSEPGIPQARIVDGRSSPIRPPRDTQVRVSAGRLVVGVIVMMVAGSSLLFLFGSADTGDGLGLRMP